MGMPPRTPGAPAGDRRRCCRTDAQSHARCPARCPPALATLRAGDTQRAKAAEATEPVLLPAPSGLGDAT